MAIVVSIVVGLALVAGGLAWWTGRNAGSNPGWAPIGQAVVVGNTTYTVNSVEISDDPIMGWIEPKGSFVIVNLTLVNNSSSTVFFTGNTPTFLDGTNTEWDTSEADFMYPQSLWLTVLEPDIPVTGHLVYDVPTPQIPGSHLEVKDLARGGTKTAQLALT